MPRPAALLRVSSGSRVRFHPPPFLFVAPKRKAPWTVEKKRALFLNPVRPGHSTRFSSAFAVTSLLPAPGPAPSASLRRHKFRIACFRLAAKMHSLHCASFPHKIFDFVGAPICCLRTGRHCCRAARLSRAAGGDASTMSAAAAASDSSIRRPRAADDSQSCLVAFLS